MHGALGVRLPANCQVPTSKKCGSVELGFFDLGRWRLGVFLLLITLHASTGFAHHSFAAEYAGKKPTTLSGTVTKVEWTNPHVHFFLNVKDQTGATTQWEFTMGAVNGLFRRGWSKEMLKPGDAVTVDGYLARDGSRLVAGPERRTAMEGGCPIIADGECIGGIGIADGDWATDARIAQQAVEAIGASHGG